jgi:hypothetical protein
VHSSGLKETKKHNFINDKTPTKALNNDINHDLNRADKRSLSHRKNIKDVSSVKDLA